MKIFYVAFAIFFVLSCNTLDKSTPAGDSVVYNYEKISTKRSAVNPDPVKIYAETIKSFETTDEFKVSLLETKETFHYLIKIQYKSIDAEDTLKVPNFGVQPAVEIKKGDTRPSCIVGFYDEKKQFRESKLIYFDDNKLKVKVLKHYAVGALPR